MARIAKQLQVACKVASTPLQRLRVVDLVRNAHFLIAHAAFVPIPVRHETLERERDVPRAHF